MPEAEEELDPTVEIVHKAANWWLEEASYTALEGMKD